MKSRWYSLFTSKAAIVITAAALIFLIVLLISFSRHGISGVYRGNINGTYIDDMNTLSFDDDNSLYYLSDGGTASRQGGFEKLDDNTVYIKDGPLEGSVALFDGKTVKIVDVASDEPRSCSWEKYGNYVTTIATVK